MRSHAHVSPELIAITSPICLALPEVREEKAWVGTRWRVRNHTFAHVVPIVDGWPPAYCRAAATNGPATILTFRAAGDELVALTHAPHPFFKPPWFTDILGMFIDDDTDWAEVAELITESYCCGAPQKLVNQINRPSV